MIGTYQRFFKEKVFRGKHDYILVVDHVMKKLMVRNCNM